MFVFSCYFSFSVVRLFTAYTINIIISHTVLVYRNRNNDYKVRLDYCSIPSRLFDAS